VHRKFVKKFQKISAYTPVVSADPLKILSIGAMSVGKGSHMMQELSNLGHSKGGFQIYHAGRSAEYDDYTACHVIGLGI